VKHKNHKGSLYIIARKDYVDLECRAECTLEAILEASGLGEHIMNMLPIGPPKDEESDIQIIYTSHTPDILHTTHTALIAHMQPEWPGIAPEAFQGLAGKIVKTIKPHTEADPAGLLVEFLTMFGNVVGHTPNYHVEATRHSMKLFACLVGKTS